MKTAKGHYATNVPGIFTAGDCRRGQSLIVYVTFQVYEFLVQVRFTVNVLLVGPFRKDVLVSFPILALEPELHGIDMGITSSCCRCGRIPHPNLIAIAIRW